MTERLTRNEVLRMIERDWSPDSWENMTSTDDEMFVEAIGYIRRLGKAYLELIDADDLQLPVVGESNRILPLWDFPRGGRILKLGSIAESVERVCYIDPHGELVTMDPKSYVIHEDRIILAQDAWPRVASGLPFTVFVYYTTADEPDDWTVHTTPTVMARYRKIS